MDKFAKAADRAMSRFSGQFVDTTIFKFNYLRKKLKISYSGFNIPFSKMFGRNVKIILSLGTFSETIVCIFQEIC